MGMFDYLRCEYPLPLAGANDREYQTKDTPEQYLCHYTIKANGRLCHTDMDRGAVVWDGDFHGDIRFYEYTSPNGWLEFEARFADGLLALVKLIENRAASEPSDGGAP